MPYRWRHQHITKVRYDPRWCGHEVLDDSESGWLFVSDIHQVTPHVGDPISFYGRFDASGSLLGCPIERFVIGECLIWDDTNKTQIDGIWRS